MSSFNAFNESQICRFSAKKFYLIFVVGYENRIVCGQCSTVLLFGENVNNDGKCLKCERQENIVNERKRSRESLDKQAAKMLKLSNQKFSEVQVGTTVRVPIPDVDRARGSPRNVLAVMSDVNFKFF